MTVEYLKSCKDNPPRFLKHSVLETVRRVIMYHEVDDNRWGFSYSGDAGICYIDQWIPATEDEFKNQLTCK